MFPAVSVLFAAFIPLRADPPAPASGSLPASLTQAATIDTLLAGCYDGWMTIGELLSYGNFGLGTVNRIDGELIVLDGIPYVIRGDGRVDMLADSDTVPFASVVPFDSASSADAVLTCPIDQLMTASELTAFIDRQIGDPHQPLAVRITGRFDRIKARSETGQTPPYRPLAETMKSAERSFSLGEMTGDMAGFRNPPLMKGLNVPGYHFHILNTERTCGGHLVDYRILSGQLTILPIRRFTVILPPSSENLTQTDLTIDRSEDLHQVEQPGE